MTRQDITDPMLQAAAEGIASDDHLRWLSYADRELRRLRDLLGLPTPAGYSNGEPAYDSGASARARQLRVRTETLMAAPLAPTARVAVERAFDTLLDEQGGVLAPVGR